MLTVTTLALWHGIGDTVNMRARNAAVPRPYHHGRLRDSLVEAGLQLARPDGPSGLGLRAATRLAGVSHNAAYRHFADHDELLAAVGARCMRELALRMEARQARVRKRDPVERAWSMLFAIGETYVEFAVTETGWFRTAFSAYQDVPDPSSMSSPHDMANGGRGDSGLTPFDLLTARLDDLVDVGAVAVQRRPGLEYAAWSAVHGLSTLLIDGPLRGLPTAERDKATHVVLDVVARGIGAPG